MGRAPLVSLCMIVRDGGASLRRCLASARPLADEIVVVDTGSRDDSVAVARSFGATVLERPWDDDFAAARNHGLAAARGRFVLLLDADEVLECPDPEGLRRLLGRSDHVAWFVTIHSDLGRGDDLESNVIRLWRHAADVRFRYPIHEQVLPDLERVAAREGRRFALLADSTIRHSGYTPDAIERQGKVERNVRIFRKAVARHPDEPYLWFKFADFLRGHADRRDEALAAAQRASALLAATPDGPRRRVPYWSELQAITVAALLDAKRLDEALRQLEAEPPDALGAPAYHYVAALALEEAGRLDEALHQVDRCCGAKKPPDATAWRPGLVGPQGEALRARLLLRKGDSPAALAAAERALALRPGYPAAIQLRADAFLQSGRPSEAVASLLAELKRKEEPRLWEQVARILSMLGKQDEAERCLARARRRELQPVAE
ncbi:MAG TPA: glycosyltransferase [Planctomycetota bacterium]|nr:glycosyltransferase [Planctomycetota bacterium]